MSTTLSSPSPPQSAWVVRRAKLFEAGDYPDKGVNVSVDHLHQLAAGFHEPVPLLIEHSESPLEIGYLSSVFCEGHELFGTITLSPEAEALVERSNAKSLSLGLAPDLSSIREVSLVRHPRIPSARLFGGALTFVGNLHSSPLSKEWEQLRRARVQQEVDDLTREGRLCPAQAQFAEALLLSEDTIEFDGESRPVRQLTMELIRRQPKLNLFAELTPAPMADHSNHLMLPEEAEFYRRHFPDIPLDEIAKKRRR